MSWALTLGFLGLIGIGILILIYILKPNYQQKIISSTHVWKLSLKYRRKRVPINRFRNILIFLCQVLIITACSMIMAQPYIDATAEDAVRDQIIIVDASAGMRTTNGTETRFERAIAQAKSLVDETCDNDGVVSVILAGKEAALLVQDESSREAAKAALDEAVCTYGAADIDGAVALAQSVLDLHASGLTVYDSTVTLFTDDEYINTGNIEAVNVSQGEWNAAILNASAVIEENYYNFEVEIASYDLATDVMLHVTVNGVNAFDDTRDPAPVEYRIPVRCEVDMEGNAVTMKKTVRTSEEVTVTGDPVGIASYESVYFYLEDCADSFVSDNEFFLYGGTRDTLKVQIWSSDTNSFFWQAMGVLQNNLRSTRDITYTQLKTEDTPATEGYDLYIFEHQLPESLLTNGIPKDGVVIISDPDRTMEGLGIDFGDRVRISEAGDPLAPGEEHPLTQYIVPERIEISEYVRIVSSEGYSNLLYCGGDPVVLVRNEPDFKLVVMPFSLNMSTFPARWDFAIFFYNLVHYFMPLTVEKYDYEVDETVEFDCRSSLLSVRGQSGEIAQYEEFPGEIVFSEPGTYIFSQVPISNVPMETLIYVRVPESESDISRTVDALNDVIIKQQEEPVDLDLLVYFAAALVALLFLEWWLQSRENF